MKKISSPICKIICAKCDQLIATAWGWVYDEVGNAYDLCGKDARAIRYASKDEKRAIIADIIARWRYRRAA